MMNQQMHIRKYVQSYINMLNYIHVIEHIYKYAFVGIIISTDVEEITSTLS